MNGLREQNQDPVRFKIGLRDFLIQLREFQGQEDDGELFADEKEAALAMKLEGERERATNIPGMLKVSSSLRSTAADYCAALRDEHPGRGTVIGSERDRVIQHSEVISWSPRFSPTPF